MKKKSLIIGAISTVASVAAGVLIKKTYDNKSKQKGGALKNNGSIMFTTSLVDLYDPYTDKDTLISEEDMIEEFRKETSL